MSSEMIENNTPEEVSLSTERFLTFRSDELNLGVSTDYVIEIITNHTITPLPLLPDYVKGIINLRGQIIPIMDIRLRMGKPAIDYTKTTCIIVLNINSVMIGIIVDAVWQVIDIDKSQISSVPTESQREFVDGMISLADGSTLLFLDCEQIIEPY